MSARHSRLFAVLATIAAALHAPGGGGGGSGGGEALAQTLYALQDLQGNPAYPWAISADGSTVVGHIETTFSTAVAFRWTKAGDVAPLLPGPYSSAARGVSEDGSVIIAAMGNQQAPGGQAVVVRWKDGVVTHHFPYGPGTTAYPGWHGCLDARGLFFAGAGGDAGAFRSDGVSTDIIPPPFNFAVHAQAISANGTTVVGTAGETLPNGGSASRPYRWNQGAMEVLELTGSHEVSGVSGDGSAVVGSSSGEFGVIAKRWGVGGATYGNPSPGSTYMAAAAISADGATVGGRYVVASSGNVHAWITNSVGSPMHFADFLSVRGVNTLGWTFFDVRAISMDSTVIAGTGRYLNTPCGFVVDLRKDSDQDGLYDDWEINGIPYLDFGAVHRLILPGANPLRKDIYVEVDARSGQAPAQNALNRVIAAFDQAPVPAVPGLAGGLPGVTLHAEIDEGNLLIIGTYTTPWAEYHQDKEQNFGTADERQRVDWASRKKAKAMAYRYCLFVNTIPGALGRAELVHDAPAEGPRVGTNDFMIGLGAYTPPPGRSLEDAQAAAFMHELGHTLGLYHGGGDPAQNFNPNHFSVMSYLWAGVRNYGVLAPVPTLYLNYSDYPVPLLNEGALDETLGIRGNHNMRVPIVVRASITESFCGDPPTNHGTCFRTNEHNILYTCVNYVPSQGPVDWNNDRVISPLHSTVCADPNGLKTPSPNEILSSWDEWGMLAYDFRDSPFYSNLEAPAYDDPCPSQEVENYLATLDPPPPQPPCTGAAPIVQAPAPASALGCGPVGAEFSVDFAGVEPFTMQWRWRDTTQNPAAWVDLADGTMPFGTIVTGAAGYHLRVHNIAGQEFGSMSVQLSCRVTDACGLSADSPECTLLADCTPSNDACANAILLAGGVAVNGTNLLATQDGATTCPGNGPDVWYLYQPTTSGAVSVDTCGSTMDTVLTLFTGACGALTQVACNDDSCGRSSVVAYATTAGQSYFIRVGGYGGGTGNFVVRAVPLVPPANDLCANGIFLADGAPVNGTNVDASQDGAATCAGSGVDVWYAYQPLTPATVTFDTCGSSFDTVLTIFTGECGALSQVACNDDGCGVSSSINYAASAGQTYLIRVSGYNGRVGSFVVRAVGGGGIIPPGCGSTDFDGDGDNGTDLDIEAFFACLGGDCCATCGDADFDGDGDTGTDLDIEAFFRVLGGGSC